jgi:hypothetical protein
MGGELGTSDDVFAYVNAMAHEYGWINRFKLPESGMAM